MGNFELQRKNMVENQVRPSDLTDRRILRAMLATPRELFVADSMRSLAYSDQPVPMQEAGDGGPLRWLLPPAVFAKLVQDLGISENGIVLEIGTGTGYGAAVLSHLARKVIALESDAQLARRAVANLEKLGIGNVAVVTGPLSQGWEQEGPYDAILLEGAVPEVPRPVLDQLKDGGRLAVVLGDGHVGKATRWVRDGSVFGDQALFDAAVPALPGFERKAQFVF